jgi:hypothetical protein
MRQRSSNSKLWAQAGALVLLALLLLAWLVHAETKPLNRDELKIEVAGLRSTAAEARLLAEQTLATHTTRPFFETETYLLNDKTKTAKQALDSAKVESGLEAKHLQARQLAGELQNECEKLSGSFANSAEMNRSKNSLEQLTTRLKELEESLKR